MVQRWVWKQRRRHFQWWWSAATAQIDRTGGGEQDRRGSMAGASEACGKLSGKLPAIMVIAETLLPFFGSIAGQQWRGLAAMTLDDARSRPMVGWWSEAPQVGRKSLRNVPPFHLFPAPTVGSLPFSGDGKPFRLGDRGWFDRGE